MVWDLDLQAAATYYFRVRPKVKGDGKVLVKGKRVFDAAIKGTDFENLDLLARGFFLPQPGSDFGGCQATLQAVVTVTQALAEDYDYIFLDCPPSISLVSENIFRASDAILMPMIPATLSARTLDQLLAFLGEHSQLGELRGCPCLLWWIVANACIWA